MYVPGRVNPLMCQLRRSARLKHVHPNPEDEFCFQDIGPNYKIISDYEQQILQARKNDTRIFSEPLTVQKMYPDGYMLLNGHHRWAAAVRLGEEKVPVRIVNLTTLNEVQKMIRDAKTSGAGYIDVGKGVEPIRDSGVGTLIIHADCTGERITLRLDDILQEEGRIFGQAGIIPGLVALVIIEYLGIGLNQRVFSDHFGIETGRIAGGTARADDQQRSHEEEGKCVFHRIVFHLLQTYCFFCVFP